MRLTTSCLGAAALLLVLALQNACSDGAEEPHESAIDPVTNGEDAGGLGTPVPAAADDLHTFTASGAGGGIFGTWIIDAYGLPAFSYTLDERTDPRGKWPNSEDIFPVRRERRDHFNVTGNDRVKMMAVDDGYVQLFGDERGPTWMNRFSEEQKNLAGGFSYVKDGADTYATAFRWAPAGSQTRRVFGIGYYETTNRYHGLAVRHRIHAPAGDEPFVIDEVELTNESTDVKDVSHYEYWDVNRHQLLTEWLRTGLGAQPSDQKRDALNAKFVQRVAYDAAAGTLASSMSPAAGQTVPPRDDMSAWDAYPPAIFLERLAGNVDDVYTDQRSFFGAGGVARPSAVATPRAGEVLAPVSGDGQPAMLAMRSNVHLAKGEKKTLRFAYGYEPKGVPGMQRARAYAAPADPLGDSLAAWKKRLAYVKVPGASSEMHRELAWRSHVLLGHTVQNDYYGEKYTAQGSAYLYLHGADGVPRDQALYAVATSYLDPSVAKGNLRMVMGVTDAVTGQKAYSFTGYGVNEGASLHNSPSDIDLFFFVGLSEYLAATGDRAFLGDHVAFHPKTSSFLPPGANGTSVLDHVRVAFRHLKDKVGLGSHGLVRISDGDWSDGIVYEDLSPSAVALTTSNGESIPNSQMALYVLPLIADQIAALDPVLAAEMRAYASTLAAPVRSAFGTRWFGRAWVRNSINQSYLKGTDAASDPYRANFIDLEAQPWGILAGALDANQTKTVLDEIETRLDADSPIGPRLRQGGQVWPAISQLMTWAYARHRPAAAWRSLDEHLYATHAQTFPAQWMGILEGPDGFDSAGSAGGTWSSPVTPMTDFPVANMNPEAMMFVGLLRTAGVEPVADGLLVSPRNDPAHRTYTVDLPLLRLDVTPGKVAGIYRAKNAGSVVLHVNVPGKTVKIPLTFVKGQEIPFAVTY